MPADVEALLCQLRHDHDAVRVTDALHDGAAVTKAHDGVQLVTSLPHRCTADRSLQGRVRLSAATTGLAWVDAKRAVSITSSAHLTKCDSLDAAQRTSRDLTGLSAID